MPSPIQAQRAFFDAIAERYDRTHALAGAASKQRLADVLALVRGAQRVLVLGLGTGRELPALLDAGHEVTGFELSDRMIAIMERRSRTAPVARGDFWEAPWPFADASFDAVLALHGTLAHPADDAALPRFAGELARVVRPLGLAIFEVPGPEVVPSLDGVALAGATFRALDDGLGFVHEERGHAIEGRAFADDEWPALLGHAFDVHVEPLPPVERRVVARRRA